ncbi:helix-turn-helix transcriptional regulator [Tenacibaculum xiamenense]|uniref:helix-turn-helix transcriptional regulator n=1 Tax=Tenacibaculum xiamenense TaxID=1261553 RepID=UPI00389660F6
MANKKINLLFNGILQEQYHSSNCGILSRKYSVNPLYGNGSAITYSFDGLYIEYLNTTFHDDFVFNEQSSTNTLELSLLLSGEKTMECENMNMEIVQQEQECFLFSSDGKSINTTYFRDTLIKEIKIRMYYEFIKKHQLIDLITHIQQFHLREKECNFFATSFSSKTDEIASEILSDTRSGILKRLFLEGKTLELVSTLKQKNAIGRSPQSLIKKLYDVKKIILSNLNEPFSVKELAKKVLLNDTVLKKEYKRVFNTTISEYSLQVRMDKAKELLSHTNKPIYEISDMVGYKNPTHFSAAFKKHSKQTPKQFRSLSFKI